MSDDLQWIDTIAEATVEAIAAEPFEPMGVLSYHGQVEILPLDDAERKFHALKRDFDWIVSRLTTVTVFEIYTA